MSVRLDDDRVVTGTHVVIATGTKARPLSYDSSGPLMTLRTSDDAARLDLVATALDPESVVAIIGGGFVGAEVATSLAARGLRPVVLEAQERPLIAVVGMKPRAGSTHWLPPRESRCALVSASAT